MSEGALLNLPPILLPRRINVNAVEAEEGEKG